MIKCHERNSDCPYAAKVLDVGGSEGAELRQRAGRELDILRELVHPRVVTLIDAFDNQNKIILVME